MVMKLKWDKWQTEVLEFEGNITIRAGRQVGKSEVISEKAARLALKYPGTKTMIIAASQRQSSLLFEKVRANIDTREKDEGISLYLEKPTMTKILLKNGSRIYCLPTGRTGHFIRGFDLDFLIADEAAFIPESVWLAVMPMIAVSRKVKGFGFIILLSTPFGKGGYFFHSFTDDAFRSFHVSSETCVRIPRSFLKKERESLTKDQYRQEYLGEFSDEWNQFFSTKLIKDRMLIPGWSLKEDRRANSNFYLGVDFARYGGDENAFVVVELAEHRLKVVKVFTTDRVNTTDTIGRIVEINKIFHFSKIFVDDGGLGGPILDSLVDILGRKVVGLNNASRRFQIQGEEKKRGILKEDLYSNALMLMETAKLDLINDMTLLKSLKCITFEYGKETRKIKIFGDYSHVAEAMVRACWCIKERGLRLFCH